METANKIFINRKFNCSASQLFDWLVKPSLIVQWFGPKHLSIGAVQTDLQLGGNYSIELLKPNDQNFFIKGKYIEINAPDLLVFTFQYIGLSIAPPNSIVKIKIEELNQNESLLTLTQDFEHTPSDMDSRTKAWEHMFLILANQINEEVKKS